MKDKELTISRRRVFRSFFLSVVRIPPIFVSVMSVVVSAVLLFVYNTIGRAKRWSRASENHYV